MSTLKEDLTAIKEIQDGLVGNKVARFSYTQNAYEANTVDGVNEYNVNNEQNIPNGTASIMKVNSTVLDKGYRAQASSITRMLMNHFLGRISYNLNKVNDNMQNLLNTLITKFPTSLPADGGNADTANMVGHSLTFGSKLFNGSSDVTIEAGDLGALTSHQPFGVFCPDFGKAETIMLVRSTGDGQHYANTPYTIPSDGWILNFNADVKENRSMDIDRRFVAGAPSQILLGTFLDSSNTPTKILLQNHGCPYPVKKGQVVSCSNNSENVTIRYAPCIGK